MLDKYLKKFTDIFKNLDNSTLKIMKYGIKISFGILVFSTILLFTYNISINNPHLYHIGITMFRMGLSFITYFIICGIVVDKLAKSNLTF